MSEQAVIETRPLWYQVFYGRAAQWTHRFLIEGDSRALDAAITDSTTVAVTAARALRDVGQDDPADMRPRLHWPIGRGARERRAWTEFLSVSMEPTAILLLAGLIRRKGGSVQSEVPQTRAKLLTILEGAEDTDPDPLVGYVLLRPEPSYRPRYNLACYHAGRENDAKALETLSRALADAPRDEQAFLASWARRDPSLAGLAARWPAQFGDAVKPFEPPPLPSTEDAPRRAPWRRRPLAD